MPSRKLDEDRARACFAELTDALLVGLEQVRAKARSTWLCDDLQKLNGEDWYEPFKLLHGGYIAFAAGRSEEAMKLLGLKRAARMRTRCGSPKGYARALAVAGRKDQARRRCRIFCLASPTTRWRRSPSKTCVPDVRKFRR